jgi:hypothetical protein
MLSLKKYAWLCVLGAEVACFVGLIGAYLPVRTAREPRHSTKHSWRRSRDLSGVTQVSSATIRRTSVLLRTVQESPRIRTPLIELFAAR